MEFLRGVRALLFDLDGTLVDTAPDITAAVDATLRSLEHPPLESATVRSYIGRGIDTLLHRVLTRERDGSATLELHERARDVFFREYGAHNGRTAVVYPGVREGLEHARRIGLSMACVTNKLQTFSDDLLKLVDLDAYFDFVIGGDALPKRKPDPEPLLHAAALLGVAPGECLMIGDSSNDAMAARAAGMPVVLVPYGYTEDQPIETIECDAVVESVALVVAAIDRANARGRHTSLDSLRA
ncbi:MAG: phosphoglycolate phosphatase [Rhodanobacteraceae bacterium]